MYLSLCTGIMYFAAIFVANLLTVLMYVVSYSHKLTRESQLKQSFTQFAPVCPSSGILTYDKPTYILFVSPT